MTIMFFVLLSFLIAVDLILWKVVTDRRLWDLLMFCGAAPIIHEYLGDSFGFHILALFLLAITTSVIAAIIIREPKVMLKRK